MPNTRKFDKWVIQKNNKGWDRHKTYVAFVILFQQAHGRYPSEAEYLSDIVPYLVKVGVNKPGKKTAENHQLYSPVFYGFLKYNSDKIEPTDLGMAILLDPANLFRTEEVFIMYMEYTAFNNGASGSDPKYNEIMPLREVFENLVTINKISFKDLNEKFIYITPGSDIRTIGASITRDSDPKWEYALKWALESELITTDGNLSLVSRGSDSKPRPGFTPDANIFPTEKLIRMITSVDTYKKDLFSKFSINADEIDIDKIIETIKPVDSKQSKGRDGALQSAFRQFLLERDKKCFICGIKHPLVLTASHILSYELCKGSQQFDPNNGLLLCDIHDALFDSGLMTFMDGELTFSSELSSKDKDIVSMLPHTTNYVLSCEMQAYMELNNEYEFEKFKSEVRAKRNKFKKDNLD